MFISSDCVIIKTIYYETVKFRNYKVSKYLFMSEIKDRKNAKTPGRKRDDTLDKRIIEAAIDILEDVGFDSMTMDMVAAHVKAGKATVYRRWASKAELVRDALVWMSATSVDLENLPDTGTLRSDLLGVVKPHSLEYSRRKLRVLAGLGSFFSEHKRLAGDVNAQIFGPWTDVNRLLMRRALERGEIANEAGIEMACQVIVSMTYYRTVTLNEPFDKDVYSSLLDDLLLPALK